VAGKEPDVYVFPCEVVAEGMRYFFSGHYPNSTSFHLSLDFKPQGRTKEKDVPTVGQHINANSYKEIFDGLGVKPTVG
jgi:hypothetical protein